MAVRVQVNVEQVPAAPSRQLDRDALRTLLTDAVRATLADRGRDEAEVSVTLLADPEIAALNRRYLDREGPTDVIAFPLSDAEEPPLGDVYVGWDRALAQAERLGVPAAEELARLAVHGTLHVLGHEHPEDDGREQSEMWAIQERIVRRVREEEA